MPLDLPEFLSVKYQGYGGICRRYCTWDVLGSSPGCVRKRIYLKPFVPNHKQITPQQGTAKMEVVEPVTSRTSTWSKWKCGSTFLSSSSKRSGVLHPETLLQLYTIQVLCFWQTECTQQWWDAHHLCKALTATTVIPNHPLFPNLTNTHLSCAPSRKQKGKLDWLTVRQRCQPWTTQNTRHACSWDVDEDQITLYSKLMQKTR